MARKLKMSGGYSYSELRKWLRETEIFGQGMGCFEIVDSEKLHLPYPYNLAPPWFDRTPKGELVINAMFGLNKLSDFVLFPMATMAVVTSKTKRLLRGERNG